MNPTRSEAIKRFLIAKTHQDLASLYDLSLECQVNVGQFNGTRVSKEFKGRQWMAWTDGVEEWKSFRIPYNAATEPEYKDVPMNFNLEKYVEGIGMTGWDWVNKVSKWVAFDFDAISGHSEKHGAKLDSEELKKVQEAASNIEWITVRKSTSGKGLHLYVFLPPIKTRNHTEHMALARAILGQMVAITGFAFNTKVDVCGGNMWVWHRKMEGTDGLTLLKQGRVLTEDEIPKHWEDHVKVVSGRRKRTLPQEIPESQEKSFEELTTQRLHIPLDEEHKKLVDFLRNEFPGSWWWDQDNWMLVTHTYCLKKAHEELRLKGIFETVSEGRHKEGDWNLFMFPNRRGAWSVRRYSKGVKEASTWDQDGSGWTRCFLNKEPDLATVARACNGVEDFKSGGFVFPTAEEATKAALLLGVSLDVPRETIMRKCTLKEHKDGRLVVLLDGDGHRDQGVNFYGWLPDKRATTWSKIYNVQLNSHDVEVETSRYDDVIRHLVDEADKDAGWVINSEGNWHQEPLTNVTLALGSLGLNTKEAKQLQGSSVLQYWKLVNRPFQPEYIGSRQWNRNSAQFAYTPNLESDTLVYPTWTRMLEHCGNSLTEAIQNNEWCRSNGILTGADYLKIWLASLFQQPLKSLPYLFFYGPQNTGKSTFHLAIHLLLKNGNGYKRADHALTTNFNGELEGGIICVIEETNLKKDKKAYEKIKDLVTSPQIAIHPKGMTPYLVPNSTHWIQCHNEHDACPISMGDTRITMIYVDRFKEMMDKDTMFSLLAKEAPDFLGEILKLEIPKSPDRLNIPVIITDDKLSMESNNRNSLEIFIDEFCHYVPGEAISVRDFYEKFVQWCPGDEAHYWTKHRISKSMDPKYIRGRHAKNAQWHYGNMSFEIPNPNEEPKPKLVLAGEILRPLVKQ